MTRKRPRKLKRSEATPLSPRRTEEEFVQAFIDAAVLNPPQAKRLLREHPELKDIRVLHGETILHFLAVEGYSDAVQLLGELGFDVNATNRFGETVLTEACMLGNERVAKVLIDLGADVNIQSETMDNPLHCAVRSGNAHLVDLLLSSGADPAYVTNTGETIVDALPSSPKRLALEKVMQRFGIRTDPG